MENLKVASSIVEMIVLLFQIGFIFHTLEYFNRARKTRIQRVHAAKAKTYQISLLTLPLLVILRPISDEIPYFPLWMAIGLFLIQLWILVPIVIQRPVGVIYMINGKPEFEYFMTKNEQVEFIEHLPKSTKYKVVNSISRGETSSIIIKKFHFKQWKTRKTNGL